MGGSSNELLNVDKNGVDVSLPVRILTVMYSHLRQGKVCFATFLESQTSGFVFCVHSFVLFLPGDLWPLKSREVLRHKLGTTIKCRGSTQ